MRSGRRNPFPANSLEVSEPSSKQIGLLPLEMCLGADVQIVLLYHMHKQFEVHFRERGNFDGSWLRDCQMAECVCFGEVSAGT
jgi:hypothetical protein